MMLVVNPGLWGNFWIALGTHWDHRHSAWMDGGGYAMMASELLGSSQTVNQTLGRPAVGYLANRLDLDISKSAVCAVQCRSLLLPQQLQADAATAAATRVEGFVSKRP
ncbi:hypothetical protein GCM10025779_24210 [Arthrobacter cryoconiti]